MIRTFNEQKTFIANQPRAVLTFLPHWTPPTPANDHPRPILADPPESRLRYKGRGAPIGWSVPTRIEERRSRMREVGARMMAREGGAKVAVMDVARAADVPISASAHGYRRRADLVYDILYAYVDALHEYVGAMDEALADAPGETRLTRVIAAMLDGMDDHRDAYHLMRAALPSLAADRRDVLHYATRTLIHRFVPILEAVVEGLAQRRDLRAPLLQCLFGMISHTPAWFRDHGRLSRHDYAAMLARAITETGRAAVAPMPGTRSA